MQSFLILGFLFGNTEAVFKVVDGFFYINMDLVSGIPFGRAAFYTGISPEIPFGINIDHPPTGRGCTGVITMIYATFG